MMPIRLGVLSSLRLMSEGCRQPRICDSLLYVHRRMSHDCKPNAYSVHQWGFSAHTHMGPGCKMHRRPSSCNSRLISAQGIESAGDQAVLTVQNIIGQ